MANGSASAKDQEILIRAPRNVREMNLGVDLQKQVWGYTDIETVPDQIFVVAQESGGQVLLAFDQSKPVGFALAFAAMHQGSTYLHSHMVAVIPEYQNRGVGRLLKFAQRDDAISRGIDLIEWTFDPLQLRNAHFNLVRLGAVIRRYIPNCYGHTSSPLHAGLPTDRLVAQWRIQSARVQEVLSGKRRPPASTGIRIPLPANIREICQSDYAQAEKIQTQVREQFETNFRLGRAAVGFELNDTQGVYILEPYED